VLGPSRGVKQECPLSTLLFALLFSDMGEWMQKPVEADLPCDVYGVALFVHKCIKIADAAAVAAARQQPR
jgi:hypothetical protein